MIRSYYEKAPQVRAAFVADNATIIGDVVLEEGSSVWFGAVVRGDDEKIIIGKNSSIQDNCTLHVDSEHSLTIGENVSVGHNAVVHGCTVGNNCIIGMNSTVLNGAKIGNNCIVGAGAVVTQNKEFPDGSLIIGVPARAVGKVDAASLEHIINNAAHYRRQSEKYAAESKPPVINI